MTNEQRWRAYCNYIDSHIIKQIEWEVTMTDNKQKWHDKMKDYPCYKPAIPFYDYCLNVEENVKKYDCDKCFEVNGLWDCIE